MGLDWAVWRRLVDYGLKRPNLVREYLDERRAALQAEADNAESEIERIRRRLEQVEQEAPSLQPPECAWCVER